MLKEASRQIYRISNIAKTNQFLGSRDLALQIRGEVEALLKNGHEVEINFSKIAISHSFADELVGILLLENGPDVLERVIFKDCVDSVKAAIQFVVADRYDQFVKTRTH
jgi:hypothetical protein